MLPGNRTLAKKPAMMIARTGIAIHAASHMIAAGRIEMKVSAMPASMPSIAARGVTLRTHGPKNAPARMISPMMKAQAMPADHALIGSFVVKKIGSMITKVTMNMGGTLGP